MEKDHMIKRLFMTIIGVTLTGVSVGILKFANLGTDPYTVFATGLGNLVGMSYSQMYIIITGILLVVTFILDRHYIGIATILNLFIIGIAGQLTLQLLENHFIAQGLLTKMLVLLLGLLILCTGSSLYFTADLGVSAYDAMALIADKKTPVPFRICRIITDIICVVVGFSCNATIGIATVVTAFFMGPVIDLFNKQIAEPFLYGKSHGLCEQN